MDSDTAKAHPKTTSTTKTMERNEGVIICHTNTNTMLIRAKY